MWISESELRAKMDYAVERYHKLTKQKKDMEKVVSKGRRKNSKKNLELIEVAEGKVCPYVDAIDYCITSECHAWDKILVPVPIGIQTSMLGFGDLGYINKQLPCGGVCNFSGQHNAT